MVSRLRFRIDQHDKNIKVNGFPLRKRVCHVFRYYSLEIWRVNLLFIHLFITYWLRWPDGVQLVEYHASLLHSGDQQSYINYYIFNE